MEITINTNAPEPVYEQIVRQIQAAVTAGALPPGTSLPPVRQLASDLVLNRNTVARAYRALEEQGVIRTAGRKGTFVRPNAAAEVDRQKTGRSERAMRHFIEGLLSDGLTRNEIAELFASTLRLTTKKRAHP
jgi:GntR family transcriptional regulator